MDDFDSWPLKPPHRPRPMTLARALAHECARAVAKRNRWQVSASSNPAAWRQMMLGCHLVSGLTPWRRG